MVLDGPARTAGRRIPLVGWQTRAQPFNRCPDDGQVLDRGVHGALLARIDSSIDRWHRSGISPGRSSQLGERASRGPGRRPWPAGLRVPPAPVEPARAGGLSDARWEGRRADAAMACFMVRITYLYG